MYVRVKDIEKSYGSGGSYARVLDGVSLTLKQGQMCVILGPSGSGKSTLLNVIGGLDTVDAGQIIIGGHEITGLKPAALSEYRRRTLGFVFQFYNLIPNLTVRENIEVCRYLSENPLETEELIHVLGLSEHKNKFPSQLSGGQQQRCAIARALVKNPKLLLCDEPTGALDSKTAREILKLLELVNGKYKTTMLLVTHNDVIKDMVHKVIRLRDGQIVKKYENQERVPAAELVW